MNALDECTVTRRTLEKMFFTAEKNIALPLEPKLEMIDRYEISKLALQLRGYIWAEEIQNDTAALTVEWPATWWQAFKARWFPRWARRRWPIKLASKTVIHKFTVKAKLPEYRYVAPRGEKYAFVAEMSRPASSIFRAYADE